MNEILEQLKATTFLLEKICKQHNINPEICNGEECCSAIDIIDENKRLINSNGWISVDDELPEYFDTYLVAYRAICDENTDEVVEIDFCTAHFNPELKKWFAKDGLFYRNRKVIVTHWQHLPQPPKE